MIEALKDFFGLEDEEEKKLEPEGYIVQASEWPEKVNKRITESVSSTAQKGVSGIEITANHPDSITNQAAREIKNFQEQENISVNIHATMQLRTAMAEENNYNRVHQYMKGYIKKAGDINADYVNLHTSAFPSPEIGRMRGVRYEVMVTPKGEPLKDFIVDLSKKHYSSETYEWLVKEWNKIGLIGRWDVIEVIEDGEIEKLIPDEYVSKIREQILRRRRRQAEITGRNPDDVEVTWGEALEEAKKNYENEGTHIMKRFKELPKEDDLRIKILKRAAKHVLEEKGDILFEERNVMNEFRVYKLMGWWMYENGHPIWRRICGNQDPDELKEQSSGERGMKKLVDAVAGRYLEGHVKHWIEDLEENDVKITLETPDARNPEYLGHYRLVRPERIYHVVKTINHPNVKLCFDFEHIATHGYDVKKLLDEAPDNLGEETYLVHLSSSPSPGHEHFPIQKGERELYEMLWKLKTKGFEEGYLTFERGGGEGAGGQGDTVWEESIPRIKEMAIFLEDNISPDELPDWFYGYDEKEFKRDQAVVLSKTFEPLKGLIESPQMGDTLLGEYAVETEPRMRGEDGWKTEEHQ